MKALLILMLVVLAIALALPMGMGGMAECPMCTSPDLRTLVGMCAAVLLSVVVLLMLFSAFRIGMNRTELRGQLTGRSIYRPPRSA